MSEIESRVRLVITEHLGVDASRVTPEATITGDLGADSLDAFELVMAFEVEFACDISDTEFQRIKTVQDAIDLLTKKTAKAAA